MSVAVRRESLRLPVMERARDALAPNPSVDVRGLEARLRSHLDGEVRFDTGSRAIYSTDASNYRRIPMGVVAPRHVEDVVETVAACRAFGAPIVSRGGGTSLNGQCCTHGVVMDCSKYLDSILEVDPDRRVARVQPGVTLDALRDQTIEPYGLAFAPDPSTHSQCTFGGMIGNNSCGVHSVMSGRASDNVVEMEVLTSDGVRLVVGETDDAELRRRTSRPGREGEIYRALEEFTEHYGDEIRERFPDIPRRVSGYNLPDLLKERGRNVARALTGSEGTCATILEATVHLIPWPRERALVILGYEDIFEAADHVPQILESRAIGVEAMDQKLVTYLELQGTHAEEVSRLPGGSGWLMVEFGGGTRAEAKHYAQEMMDRLRREKDPPDMDLVDDPARETHLWEVRESALSATAFVPGAPDNWPGWEDAALPPERLGAYLRDFRELLMEFGYDCSLYGHFGQGCVHCRIGFDLITPAGIATFRRFIHRAADLVLSYGGSFSAEHGDGLSKSELLPKLYGRSLMDAFAEFKHIWDPDGILNPGKIVDPAPMTSNLRLGTRYTPAHDETVLNVSDRSDHFERAAIRCVGVGACRKRRDAFMCPSFLVTHEEMHTTRGRSRMLFEMVRGDLITDGWRSEAVLESLELCLGCKGCKKECPVGVDMASYKSEFLHHHYKGRLRPRASYSMGHIGAMARLASLAPGLANRTAHAPVLSSALKWAAGVAPELELPRLAPRSFTKWFRNRRNSESDGDTKSLGTVLILPDVFNNYFYPDSLKCAVQVLERIGYSVAAPAWLFPAIRPLIHYGFLTQARRLLWRVIERLDSHAATGDLMVCLEPSTVAVFRDEAELFFPNDARVKRVSSAMRLFSEFLADQHERALPRIGGRCVFHAHCHQKAVLNAGAARETLKRVGIDVIEPERGCCGMAGSFGFERKHAAVARAIGEQNLLPAVRQAAADDAIVVEGFSCREQIAQRTDRVPVHLADLIWSRWGEEKGVRA